MCHPLERLRLQALTGRRGDKRVVAAPFERLATAVSNTTSTRCTLLHKAHKTKQSIVRYGIACSVDDLHAQLGGAHMMPLD